MKAAQGKAELPHGWFDALCKEETESLETEFRVNAERELARIRAKIWK